MTDGLEPSLEKLRGAVERAGECGDDGKVALFTAMVECADGRPFACSPGTWSAFVGFAAADTDRD